MSNFTKVVLFAFAIFFSVNVFSMEQDLEGRSIKISDNKNQDGFCRELENLLDRCEHGYVFEPVYSLLNFLCGMFENKNN